MFKYIWWFCVKENRSIIKIGTIFYITKKEIFKPMRKVFVIKMITPLCSNLYFDIIIAIHNIELITGQPYYQCIVSVFSEIRWGQMRETHTKLSGKLSKQNDGTVYYYDTSCFGFKITGFRDYSGWRQQFF